MARAPGLPLADACRSQMMRLGTGDKLCPPVGGQVAGAPDRLGKVSSHHRAAVVRAPTLALPRRKQVGDWRARGLGPLRVSRCAAMRKAFLVLGGREACVGSWLGQARDFVPHAGRGFSPHGGGRGFLDVSRPCPSISPSPWCTTRRRCSGVCVIATTVDASGLLVFSPCPRRRFIVLHIFLPRLLGPWVDAQANPPQ